MTIQRIWALKSHQCTCNFESISTFTLFRPKLSHNSISSAKTLISAMLLVAISSYFEKTVIKQLLLSQIIPPLLLGLPKQLLPTFNLINPFYGRTHFNTLILLTLLVEYWMSNLSRIIRSEYLVYHSEHPVWYRLDNILLILKHRFKTLMYTFHASMTAPKP